MFSLAMSLDARLTKADKANDDGGSGGDGSCMKPEVAPAPLPEVEELWGTVAVPCLDL